MQKTPQGTSQEALINWRALCKFVRTASEAECQELLKLETKTKNRRGFVRRIHSRLNKLRADRERADLGVTI